MSDDYSEEKFAEELDQLLSTATGSDSNRMQLAEEMARKLYEVDDKLGAAYLGRTLLFKTQFLMAEGEIERGHKTGNEAIAIFEQAALRGDDASLMVFISLCAANAESGMEDADGWERRLDAVIQSMPSDKAERIMQHVRVLHPRLAQSLDAEATGPKPDVA